MVDMWKWRFPVISTKLLKMISNRSAGNARSPGKRPFPDFQGHVHEDESGEYRSPLLGRREAHTKRTWRGLQRAFTDPMRCLGLVLEQRISVGARRLAGSQTKRPDRRRWGLRLIFPC